jgi:rhodanese-related sulfurtransferase
VSADNVHVVALPAIEYDRLPLDELVEAARRRIARLTPAEASAAAGAGSLIVDIRSDGARLRDGVVRGSVHVPRTVLEWRLAPDSPWRSPHVGGLDTQVLLLCDQGYSSILAAATLVDLGFRRAGDVIGGFEAWRAAGLPVVPARRSRPPGELPGMAPPD